VPRHTSARISACRPMQHRGRGGASQQPTDDPDGADGVALLVSATAQAPAAGAVGAGHGAAPAAAPARGGALVGTDQRAAHKVPVKDWPEGGPGRGGGQCWWSQQAGREWAVAQVVAAVVAVEGVSARLPHLSSGASSVSWHRNNVEARTLPAPRPAVTSRPVHKVGRWPPALTPQPGLGAEKHRTAMHCTRCQGHPPPRLAWCVHNYCVLQSPVQAFWTFIKHVCGVMKGMMRVHLVARRARMQRAWRRVARRVDRCRRSL
jgi:hypothetical protein